MANFHTHLAVAAAGSGAFASALLAAEQLTPGEATALWALGAGAGLLPDIDSDSSKSIRWIFNTLAIICSLVTLLVLYPHLSLPQLWGSMAIAFLAIRFGAMEIFARFSVHRGIFHSLLVLPFFTFCTVILAHGVFGLSVAISWLAGAFVLLGAFIHLLLDEIYAVDLEGTRLKKSFGSAMKPVSMNNPLASVAMAGAVAMLFPATPPLQPFFRFVAEIDWLALMRVTL